jgi:Glycosyltransferases involved in cell wall biogenesis
MSSLSIIVVVFNMKREAPRTLFSLSTQYQRSVFESDYEVIVVENGSVEPLGEDIVQSFGNNFHYINLQERSQPSPCKAINYACLKASGECVGILIDGARIVSPGLVRAAINALQISLSPVVATLAWHLGPEHQSVSIKHGYTQAVEDLLIDSVNWKKDGYNLFTISALAGSNSQGYFGALSESTAIFMKKSKYDSLGGYDEEFDLAGGGLANLDFYKRACEYDHDELIILLGEGTFHQVHGGISSNTKTLDYLENASRQYVRLRGNPFILPRKNPLYYGRVAAQSLRWIRF